MVKNIIRQTDYEQKVILIKRIEERFVKVLMQMKRKKPKKI